MSIKYDADDHISEISNYRNGKLQGKQFFYKNGKLIKETSYSNDIKDGLWIDYSSNRDTISIVEYKNGELLE